MVSWFWLIGAIILSILPTMVKEVLGGSEIIVKSYLAIFAVALDAGSAGAAWMSAGRGVLLPAPVGTGLMALFGLDLAWTVLSVETMVATASVLEFFAGDNTIRIGGDLAGLAIAGAFLVMPSFTAIQTWAEENRRARVIAGVNVVSAAFMTVGGGIVAILQVRGYPLLFCWRRTGQGFNTQNLYGKIRAAYSRRLWGNRNRPYNLHQHADVLPERSGPTGFARWQRSLMPEREKNWFY